MSGMLQIFVEKEIDRHIREKYTHIQYPYGLCARVIRVEKRKDAFVYTLRILEQTFEDDNDFPEIPNVKSHLELAKGDIAAIVFLYSGKYIYILGRYEP
ncbi:MAG: hypothetical protein NC307_11260 [Roseburia sp.]|nr:hypothetical protein [Roseburia sp.]